MKSDWQKMRLMLVRVFISISLMGILLSYTGVTPFIHALGQFHSEWLGLVFALIVLSVVVSAYKWLILLRAQGNYLSLMTVFRIYCSALFFNNFLPSSIGSDGVRLLLAKKYCEYTAAVAASIIVDRALATISLALLGLLGAVFAQEPNAMAVFVLGCVLIVGSVVSLIVLTGWRPQFVNQKKTKWAIAWVSFAEAANELRKKPKILGYNLFLSVCFQMIVAYVVGTTMMGVADSIPWIPDLLFITSASSVMAMVPLGINGYGLREGAFVYMLQPYGYSASEALTISILFAVFVSLFSLLGGLNWLFMRPSQTQQSTNKEIHDD